MANRPNKKGNGKQYTGSEPWISMRTGSIVIAITSIVMAVLTTVQAWETKPPIEAILWGIFFGALIWVIFFGMLFFNRLMGRK